MKGIKIGKTSPTPALRVGLIKNNIIQLNKSVLTNAAPSIGAEKMKYKNHTLYKRKDNRWAVTINRNGTYKHLYGSTQDICLNKLKEFLQEEKQTKPKEKNAMLLNEWVKVWFETYKINTLKENTYISYENIIKNHITPSIGKIKLKLLTSEQIQQHLNELQKETPRQAQKVYELLKDILTKASKKDLLQFVQKPKHTAKETEILTIKEQTKFVNYCKMKNTKVTDFILLLLYNGFRPSEVKSIFIENLDFNKKTITIVEKQEQKLYIKTLKSNRTVPMLNGSFEILNKYKNTKGQLFKISNNALYNEFKQINELLKKQLSPNSLRHTFITRMQEKNVPLHIIQWLVGHEKGSRVTNKTYTHLDYEFTNNLDLNF